MKVGIIGTETTGFAALLLGVALVASQGVGVVHAQGVDPCAKQNARFEQTGRGDRDFDGLTNCQERRVVGTSAKNPDTDADGLDDGDEVASGTDPLNPDTDGDGLQDGVESEMGTDPTDVDTDDDGTADGDDLDPTDALQDQFEGAVENLACPAGGADGSITVLGLTATLTAATTYQHVADCAALADAVAVNAGGHVEVEVSGDATAGFVAVDVELEDADNDGSPDDIDTDDDNDGIPDDEDSDDSADGESDDDVSEGTN